MDKFLKCYFTCNSPVFSKKCFVIYEACSLVFLLFPHLTCPVYLFLAKKCADRVRKTGTQHWLLPLWNAPGDADLSCMT